MRWSPPRDKHEVCGTQPGCLLYFLGELGGKYEVRIHRRKSAGCRTWKVSSGAPGGLCKAEETHSLTRTREQTVGATGGCVTTESSAWLVVGCQGHRSEAGSSRSWAGAAVRARQQPSGQAPEPGYVGSPVDQPCKREQLPRRVIVILNKLCIKHLEHGSK